MTGTEEVRPGRRAISPEKRILFLMSDTGGGHRAAAQAIAEAVHHLHPKQYNTIIEDIWKGYTPWPLNRLPDIYGWLTGPGLPLWRLMWSISVRVPAHKLVLPALSAVLQREVTRYLHRLQPDLVVSVHPLLNHPGLDWLDRARLHIPFVTVVTDMVSLHPVWICPEVTQCIVPTPAAQTVALQFGMPPEKVQVYGQPVAMKFAQLNTDKRSLRHNLNLDPDRKTILLVGGGEGFGRVYDIARQLDRKVPQAQLLIVTGRNHRLKTRLQAQVWQIRTHIYGFVETMPELMHAADVLITKAGPGTLSEAFIAGLPPLISGYIPGQEWGNVRYVEEHQAGAYTPSPQRIADMVAEWLTPGNTVLQEMARNAARLARPEASLAIARQICRLVDSPPAT